MFCPKVLMPWTLEPARPQAELLRIDVEVYSASPQYVATSFARRSPRLGASAAGRRPAPRLSSRVRRAAHPSYRSAGGGTRSRPPGRGMSTGCACVGLAITNTIRPRTIAQA